MAIISVCLIVMLIAFVYLVYCYNDFVAVVNNVDNSWANINVLLKQRHDELNKLIDLCKQYMDYELSAFKQIISARQGVETAYKEHDTQTLNGEEKNLQSGVKNLMALAENYPELHANSSFQQIGDSIHKIETRIAERREFYNASVNLNNILTQQFPTIFIARICHFEKMELLAFSDSDKADVDINSAFKRE
jgi:LemA protein